MESQRHVGVVGCGYWGKNLVRNFHEIGSLKVICDVDPIRLEPLHRKYDVPVCSSYEEMLQRPDLDGIVIAAPAAQHYELAKKALEANKDVFVEKPLALRVEEAEELTAFAEKQSRILMVGHLL